MLMHWKDNPDKSMITPANENKVMHSSLRIGETKIMASDGRNAGPPEFKGFALTLNPKNKSEAERLFNALCDGGQARMPLAQTFFSPAFGMLTDKFGVDWMIMVEA